MDAAALPARGGMFFAVAFLSTGFSQSRWDWRERERERKRERETDREREMKLLFGLQRWSGVSLCFPDHMSWRACAQRVQVTVRRGSGDPLSVAAVGALGGGGGVQGSKLRAERFLFCDDDVIL